MNNNRVLYDFQINLNCKKVYKQQFLFNTFNKICLIFINVYVKNISLNIQKIVRQCINKIFHSICGKFLLLLSLLLLCIIIVFCIIIKEYCYYYYNYYYCC